MERKELHKFTKLINVKKECICDRCKDFILKGDSAYCTTSCFIRPFYTHKACAYNKDEVTNFAKMGQLIFDRKLKVDYRNLFASDLSDIIFYYDKVDSGEFEIDANYKVIDFSEFDIDYDDIDYVMWGERNL